MTDTNQSSKSRQKRKYGLCQTANNGGSRTDTLDPPPVAKRRKEETLVDKGDDKQESGADHSLTKNYDFIRFAMERPKVFLTEKGVNLDSQSSEQQGDRGQCISVSDLRHLLLYFFRVDSGLHGPRWCKVLRRTKAASMVLVVMNDVSAQDYLQNKDCFSFICNTFNEANRSPSLKVRMMSPCSYFSSFDFDLYAVPINSNQVKNLAKRKSQQAVSTHQEEHASGAVKGTLIHTENNLNGNLTCMESKAKSIQIPTVVTPPSTSENELNWTENQKCSRQQLLLSAKQLQEENYPLPFDSTDNGFVFSKEKYDPVTDNSPLFAVDCEMCMTCENHELTRVSVVNEENEVIYDELVKPFNPIINYITRYSGITKAMIDPVTKRLVDVQKELRELLPADAILCGQSLGNDLKALKMYHPYVIDTSVIYNLSGNKRMKCSLRRLAFTFLDRVIQESKLGHCSAEDALAALDLVKLKIQNGLKFGDVVFGTLSFGSDLGLHGQAVVSEKKKTSPAPQASKTGLMPVDQRWQKHFPDKDCSSVGSFFVVLEALDVSACLIGGDKLQAKFQGEPRLHCLSIASDGKACKKALESHKNNRFTWVEFNAFSNLLSRAEETTVAEASGDAEKQGCPTTEEQREILMKMDKNVKKLMKKCMDKTVVVVVMTGRSAGSEFMDGAAFVHITRQQ